MSSPSHYFTMTESSQCSLTIIFQAAMRRCGHNPTDIEVSDIINKIHDDTGSLTFEVTLGVFFLFEF